MQNETNYYSCFYINHLGIIFPEFMLYIEKADCKYMGKKQMKRGM